MPASSGKHLSQMSDATMLKLPKVTDKHHLQSISKLLSSEASAEKTKFKAARSLNQSQLEGPLSLIFSSSSLPPPPNLRTAFRNAYDLFSKDLDGYIDLPALETTSYNLGISINEDEAFDELMYADTDGDGRVSFTDFLNIITDSKRFDQAVAPKKSDMDTVDARGILFFELLSKLVESCLLPKKATETIVSYYRHKFLESTGKRAWRADSPKQAGKKHGLKKAKSTSVMSKFAGAARICVMKDRELESYMHQLQASIPPSDSPYAKAPIFPLIPNQDCRLPGKPKKDIPKLEKQRRMEPVASFEDHFFQKKRWLQEPKNLKTPKGSLTISAELGKGKRRLTMDNLKEIRLEVKKATDSYRRSIALRERNKSLKLWRRVRGSEVGLEAGNPSFYQTFSTYSWSWNVCQELVTPRELQEYDNKQYQSRSQSITSSDKPIKAGGRQRASIKK
ncbi:hypothetical protein lerEdw1_017595 [Lerista edwardsae]|nr:hypothetical protein lerEdw1_017595 [Lerista edwardsae]